MLTAMLTTKKKKELRERLEAIETNGGAEGALAEIMRAILEEIPTESEQADAVRRLIDHSEGRDA